MKKFRLKGVVLAAAVLFSTSVFAQDWVKMMQDPNTNLKEVQQAFAQYRASYIANNRLAENARVPGEKVFKRWEWFQIPRCGANGERFAPDAIWKAAEAYQRTLNPKTLAGSWTEIGPKNSSALPGAGRVNRIVRHPTNATTLYACVPSGGLWVSTNDGGAWSSTTDKLPSVIGCSDLGFDPSNANTIYMATGDGDAGDNSSVGVLKSTDAGATWNTTGLSFAAGQFKRMCRLLVDPTNGNILVATTSGIYRSTDGAATFTQVQTGTFRDMEFRPGTPATVYACGTEFFRSTNSGATWTKVTSVFPAASALSNMAMGVTAANADIIYLAAGNAAPNYGLNGIFKSTNAGVSFTKLSVNPNNGNQQWYDLCVAVNPGDANEVMLGQQTSFQKTINGGTSWTSIGGSTHVDYHDIMYVSNTTCYLASDGGVWKSTNNGGGWTELSTTIPIAQLYGFGHSTSNANLLIAGWQDNGTNMRSTGGTFQSAMGGDGMLAFISWNNNSVMWCSQYNGSLNRSINGGGGWSAMSGISETCPWVTEWNEDPVNAGTVYAGCANVWKATAGAFTKLGNVAGTSTVSITAIGVSPVNNQVMYAAKGGSLYKSTNAGTNWTVVAGGLPGGTITDIECHTTDVNKVWVTFSGFSNVNKVFQTTNGGTAWTNLSGSLPNVSMNCIKHDKNGNDALYVGSDIGVFFKDASMTVWQPFNGTGATSLPNVMVTQLDIYYTGNMLRASTYGRGMWESTLYQPGAYAPTANFTGNKSYGCPGLGVQFTDYSAGQPTSWSWTFQGGNPATSTQQHPFVTYNAPGTYSVSLIATNANGSDTKTTVSVVTISASPNAAPAATGKNYCGPATVALSATPAAPGTVRWWNQAGGGTLLGTGNNYTTPSITGTQTYYVDEAFPAGNADVTDFVDKTIGNGAMFTANDIRGLYFNVTKPIVLNSVEVYCNSTGMRTIEILDAMGNLVTDTSLNIPANANNLQTVTINRTIYPGNDYFIKFRGLIDCWRNSDGAVYPYTSSTGIVTITNSNAGSPGYYYYFYNWSFTEIVCNTARTAVTVVDTCSVVGMNDLFTSNEMSVYPNPNNGQFNLSFHVDNSDNYKIGITNAIGQTVYEETLDNFSGNYSRKIDIASYRKGVYILTVSNSKNQSVRRVLVD